MLLFEITARDPCGPHGGHSVDRASSLLYEITRHVLHQRGLTTSFALQPIYPEEHCPQATSLWQLNSYRLLWLELMCWPLTRRWRPHSDGKGDREDEATWRTDGRTAEE